MTAHKEIFISTGEVSGDLHAAALLTALRRRHPGLRAFGIGGSRLAAAGMEKSAGIEELSLVGIAEVIPRVRSIFNLLSRTKKLLSQRRPAVVLLVDSPDFNLPLAAHARRIGLKVVYYIGPTVWAWRRGRLSTIRKNVDLMLTILPFEEEIYRHAGVRASYVGHPLVEDRPVPPSPGGILSAAVIGAGKKTVAFLPGSREKEVHRLLPIFIDAAQILDRSVQGMRYLVPAASEELEAHISAACAASPGFTVVSGKAAECLSLCRAAVVASGTATLEAALAGIPFVTVYRISPLSYLIGRLMVRTPWISLPNIIAGEQVVEELLQHQCTAENVAASALRLLEDGEQRERMLRQFAIMRKKLGSGGTAERAAAAVAVEAGLVDTHPPASPTEDRKV